MLTSVAIISILSIQPNAWRTAARSDFMGRASGILYAELQRQEALIMNPCTTVTAGTTGPVTVYAGVGTAAQASGDVAFNVTTTITNTGTNIWRVTVLVAWANHPGISESIFITRQESFRTPGGCS